VVAGQGELGAAAQAGPADQGRRRDREVGEAAEQDLPPPALLPGLLAAGQVGDLLDVRAGDEAVVLAAADDESGEAPLPGPSLRLVQDALEVRHQSGAEHVHRAIREVQGEMTDRAVVDLERESFLAGPGHGR